MRKNSVSPLRSFVVICLIAVFILVPRLHSLSADEVPAETPTETATLTATWTETPTLVPTDTAIATETAIETASEMPTETVAPTDTETPTLEAIAPSVPTLTLVETPSATAPSEFSTLSPSPSATASATVPAFGVEPPLTELFTDNFDTSGLYLWTLGAGWILAPTNGGLALQSIDNDSPVTFVHNSLTDIAVQAKFQFESGLVRLSARQSDAGAYTVVLDSNGQVSLQKSGKALGAGITNPNTPGSWRTVRLSTIGDILRVAIDGIQVIVVQDSTPLPQGTISFAGIGAGEMRVDDVILSSPSNSPDHAPTASATATAMYETQWNLFFTDNFDRSWIYSWAKGTNWEIGYTSTSLGAVTSKTDKAIFLDNLLTNVIVEAQIEISGGTAQIIIRESEEGSYIAAFDPSGNVALYRGETLLKSIQVAANTYATDQRNLRLTAIHDMIYVALDGIEIISIKDAAPLHAGSIAFAGVLNPDVISPAFKVDEIKVWTLTNEQSIPQPLGAPFSNEASVGERSESRGTSLSAVGPMTNVLVYNPEDDAGNIHVRNISVSGFDSSLPIIAEANSTEAFGHISSDGSKIVFMSTYGNSQNYQNIYYANMPATGFSLPIPPSQWIPITSGNSAFNTSINQSPVFSRDSTKIAFSSNANGSWKVYVTDLINPLPTRLTNSGSGHGEFVPSWSPDGTLVSLLLNGCTSNGFDIAAVTSIPQIGSSIPCGPYPGQMLVQTFGNEGQMDGWSPDGQYILYNHLETNLGIYIKRVDGQPIRLNGGSLQTELRLTTALEGFKDDSPDWLPGGTQFLFLRSDNLPGSFGHLHFVDISINNNNVVVGQPEIDPLIVADLIPGDGIRAVPDSVQEAVQATATPGSSGTQTAVAILLTQQFHATNTAYAATQTAQATTCDLTNDPAQPLGDNFMNAANASGQVGMLRHNNVLVFARGVAHAYSDHVSKTPIELSAQLKTKSRATSFWDVNSANSIVGYTLNLWDPLIKAYSTITIQGNNMPLLRVPPYVAPLQTNQRDGGGVYLFPFDITDLSTFLFQLPPTTYGGYVSAGYGLKRAPGNRNQGLAPIPISPNGVTVVPVCNWATGNGLKYTIYTAFPDIKH